MNSINEWASKSTDGKLAEITKDVQNPDGAMIVNAMFFKRKLHNASLLTSGHGVSGLYRRESEFSDFPRSSLG